MLANTVLQVQSITAHWLNLVDYPYNFCEDVVSRMFLLTTSQRSFTTLPSNSTPSLSAIPIKTNRLPNAYMRRSKAKVSGATTRQKICEVAGKSTNRLT